MAIYGDAFIFDNISSAAKGLMIYNVGEDGDDEVPFAGVVSAVEETVGGRWKPYFYGVQYEEKLTFTITFGVNQDRIGRGKHLTRIELDDIASWLTGHPEYKWLEVQSRELDGYRYRCMITELTPIVYGGVPWAFRATVTCDGHYAYMKPAVFSYEIRGTAQIIVPNMSAVNGYFYPTVRIKADGNGAFSIENMTDEGRTMLLTGIVKGTTVTIDNDAKLILCSNGANLYDGFNYNWLRLKRGNNKLNCVGNGHLEVICEFPMNIGA